MKKVIRLTSLLLICCFAFSGCSDNDGDFSGTDAYFVAFSLTVDGVLYPAAIVGNAIELKAPLGINLSNAEVNYKLSENATVLPEPKTITDWNSDQIFRVQAYDGSFNSFTYRVSVGDNDSEGNITLLTQADVDAFARTNISRVTGNLVIGTNALPSAGFDTITNLRGLGSIKEIEYNLVINNSFGGTDMDGLDNLEKAGGVYLGTASKIGTPFKNINFNLPALESAGNVSLRSSNLVGVSFPNLKEISSLDIASNTIASIDLGKLVRVDGNMKIWGNTVESYNEENSNKSLLIVSLPNIEEVKGDFQLDCFWAVNKVNIPKLRHAEGDLIIRYIRAVKEITLPNLETVGGTLRMQSNDAMARFSAEKLTAASSVDIASLNEYSISLKTINLPKLTALSGNFTLKYAGTEQLSLPALESIGGTLQLSNLYFIESLDVPKLKKCGKLHFLALTLFSSFDASAVGELGSIEIANCKALDTFKAPEKISGDLAYSSSIATQKFPDFINLKTVEGELKVTAFSNPALKISGIKEIGTLNLRNLSTAQSIEMPDMAKIGAFSMNGMANLTNFSAPQMTENETFTLTACIKLTNINVPKLKTVKGLFKFHGNSRANNASQSLITNLNSFSTLASVGSVEIKFAGNLGNFEGLKNVLAGLDASKWVVSDCKYNPTFQNMLDGNYTE